MTDVGLKNPDVQADLLAQRADYLRGRQALRVAGIACIILICIMVIAYTLNFFGVDPEVFHRIGAVTVVLTICTEVWAMWLLFDLRGKHVPLRWFCATCDKSLNDGVDWTCGHCDFRNAKEYLLGPCERCKTVPSSYECPFCHSLTYFTKDRIARLSARDSIRISEATQEDIRQERAHKLESRQHEVKELQLELEVARLKLQLRPPNNEVLTPRQARINWLAERLQDARDTCKTIEQTTAVERELKADLDAKEYEQPLKDRMREALEMHFEETRRKLGVPDIRV